MSIWNLFQKKSIKPIVINDEYGAFTLKNPKKDKMFDGTVDWCGEECSVHLWRDDSELVTANMALEHLHNIMSNVTKWDKRLKEYSADTMDDGDGLIEIWGESEELDEDIAPVSREEFIRRISINFIHIRPEGELEIDYSLDGMFTDHGMLIIANASGEIFSASLWG